MSNRNHLKILESGVEAWNAWREENRFIIPDLTRANLSSTEFPYFDFSYADLARADLSGTNFSYADLSRANLSYTNLTRISFPNADLSYARLASTKLSLAELTSTNFSNASFFNVTCNNSDFTRANFSQTEVQFTTFHKCIFVETDFSDCALDQCSFGDIDFQQARGLEQVKHTGPSSIGIDSIYLSGGKIPPEFLLGCGVPEELINYIPSLLGARQPFQFYSCFISYSSRDEDFAKRLHSRMRDEKLRVWFAPEDIKGGKKIYDQIESAIHIHDRLLLVISEESMQSEWVFTEIKNAFKEEKKHGRRKLFPIRLVNFDKIKAWQLIDSDWGKDLAAEIRSYHIPDFSNWKDHDAFELAFSRLLRDLKAEEKNG